VLGHQVVQLALANVAEGRVPEVVREADRLRQVGIDMERFLQ
jgi:hypothetical protein